MTVLQVPVVAGLGDAAIASKSGHGAAGQRHRRAVRVQEPGPVLHPGTVAMYDRGAKAHLVDPLLVGERLGEVVADALASVVGRAERGGAVHAQSSAYRSTIDSTSWVCQATVQVAAHLRAASWESIVRLLGLRSV